MSLFMNNFFCLDNSFIKLEEDMLSEHLDMRLRINVHVFSFSLSLFFSGTWTVKSHECTLKETKCTVHALFMGLTAIFTCLKIILLQYFQFSFFSFNKNNLYPNGPLIYKLNWLCFDWRLGAAKSFAFVDFSLLEN